MGNWHTETLKLKMQVELSLWSAIKMRIAGMANLIKNTSKKVSIDELIESGRQS